MRTQRPGTYGLDSKLRGRRDGPRRRTKRYGIWGSTYCLGPKRDIKRRGLRGKWKPGTTGTAFQPERKKNY